MKDYLLDRPWLFVCIVPMVVLSGLTALSPWLVDYVALVPANTLITHTYTWNLLTAVFLERSVVRFLTDVLVTWNLMAFVVSPNAEQFGLFFVFSILACTLGASIVCFLRFVVAGLEGPLVHPLYGFGGVLVCLMMYVRRVAPPQSPSLSSRFPSLTLHHLPALFVGALTLLRLLGLKSLSEDVLFSWVGLFFSWSYLKFFYKFDDPEQSSGSAEFTFVQMFPEAFHPVLNPFTTSFQILMTLVGVFPQLDNFNSTPMQQHHLRSNSRLAIEHNPPSVNAAIDKYDAVAERRRAKAMKILDAKLAELSKEPEGWDDKSGEDSMA